MPRDIIDDPLPHRYRNAAEGGRRDGESGRHEAGGHPAGEAEQEGQPVKSRATGRRLRQRLAGPGQRDGVGSWRRVRCCRRAHERRSLGVTG